MKPNGTSDQKNIFSALRDNFFRMLWIANVASLVGSWMHETATAWLMTSMTVSPVMVALLQTAMTLPFFLMALPAGALADIIDRRKILIAAQAVMLLAACTLGICTLAGAVTPGIILVLTFVLAIAAAVNAPTWQSIIPELITSDRLQSAVTLGSVAFNVARVAGPVLGGLVLALAGPASVFFVNALSFTGVIFALVRWQYRQPEQSLPAERFFGAIRTGMGYVRNVPQVKTVLLRMGIFSFFGGSLWAFLPIIARVRLDLSPSGFGFLMCFFGIGGLAGAALLPKAGRMLRLKPLANWATLLFAASIALLSFSNLFWLTSLALVIGGVAWLVLISTYNTAILVHCSILGTRTRHVRVYARVFRAVRDRERTVGISGFMAGNNGNPHPDIDLYSPGHNSNIRAAAFGGPRRRSHPIGALAPVYGQDGTRPPRRAYPDRCRIYGRSRAYR
jgi:MFS family permease